MRGRFDPTSLYHTEYKILHAPCLNFFFFTQENPKQQYNLFKYCHSVITIMQKWQESRLYF